jgi:hypothetical protein
VASAVGELLFPGNVEDQLKQKKVSLLSFLISNFWTRGWFGGSQKNAAKTASAMQTDCLKTF